MKHYCTNRFALRGCPADDGTLYRTIIKATATVIKDGEIAGAGAFISEQGHFLTAAHVVHAVRGVKLGGSADLERLANKPAS